VSNETRHHDFTAISRLLYAYSDRIDTGDLEGLAELLADAGFGTFDSPLLRGSDRILALYKATVRIFEDGTPRTRHVVTNVVIDIDDSGDSASSSSYFTVLQAATPGSLAAIVAGRYHDKFTRSVDGWRFAERRISTDLVGDVSSHMLPAAQHLVTGTDS
jgi:ketosteroid isomerase-like protein